MKKGGKVAEEIFDTKEAAKYLGVSVSGMKKFLYVSKNLKLVPDIKAGHFLGFRKSTLDRFQERRRAKRPSKVGNGT